MKMCDTQILIVADSHMERSHRWRKKVLDQSVGFDRAAPNRTAFLIPPNQLEALDMVINNWWVITAGFLAFCGFIGYAGRDELIKYRLNKIGTITQATSIKVGKDSWTVRNFYYYVVYEFHLETPYRGNAYITRKQAISGKHFERLEKDPQVTVSYLVTNPSVSRLTSKDSDNTSRDVALLRALGVFIAVLIFVAIH